jgi:uncharacterized protein (TIGR00725 family)
MRKTIIGVMGGGSAPRQAVDDAYRLGYLIAKAGWVLLNGGRAAGVMEASARGAHDGGGLTVGILPTPDHAGMSAYVDIPILTGMGSARNVINVLSSDVVIACTGGAGTLSEVALALKSQCPVILLGFEVGTLFGHYRDAGDLVTVETPEDAIIQVRAFLAH